MSPASPAEPMLALEQAAFRARLLDTARYADPRRLARFGYKAYSQSDEDGIIAEIFRRIGTPNRSFVEIGVGNGLECNTLWLLIQGWRGLWIEAEGRHCAAIRASHRQWLGTGALRLAQAAATAENVESLIDQRQPGDVDLLSVDIDYNDYWVWAAIESIRPRAVAIEYNAAWPPPAAITVAYDPAAGWKGDSHFGASLCALANLAARKGYKLVGCNLAGVNAFFVRDDLAGDIFLAPGSAEEHHDPPRYSLAGAGGAPPPGLGPIVSVD